jgi:hypothetical protein
MQYFRRSVSKNRKAEDDEPEPVDVKTLERRELELMIGDLQKRLA